MSTIAASPLTPSPSFANPHARRTVRPRAFTVPTTHGWRLERVGAENRFDHLRTPWNALIPLDALLGIGDAQVTFDTPRGVRFAALSQRLDDFDGSAYADVCVPLLASARLIGRNIPTVIPGAPVQLWTVASQSVDMSEGDLLAVVPVGTPNLWTTGGEPRAEETASAAFGPGELVVADSPVGPLVGQFCDMPEGCSMVGRVIERFSRSGEACPWTPERADASRGHASPARVFDGGEQAA